VKHSGLSSSLLKILLMVFGVIISGAAGGTDIYRWVDGNGVVHFAANPPTRGTYEKIDMKAHRIGTIAAVAPPLASSQQTASQAESEPPPGLSPGEQAKACQEARDAISRLEPSPRVLVTTESGEVRRLDDDERLGLLEQSRSYLRDNC